MSGWGLAVSGVALAGVTCALLAAACSPDRRAGLPMLLELFTAAALLQVSGRRAWANIAALAGLVAVRVVLHVRPRPHKIARKPA